MATIGELIRTHREEILSAWTEAARQGTSAKNLTSLELASLMPEYLSLLSRDPPARDAALTSAQRGLIERHLSNRLREGFNLSEILTEFAILGRCVSRILEAGVGRDAPSLAEVAGFYAELYQTSNAVTRIFNEHALEDEQTMKRYSRLLGRLANQSEGFQHGFVPLLERLTEVLELIVEAMGGRAAVLLMQDGSVGQAPTTAATGIGAAELARAACSLEATTFAGPSGTAAGEAGEVQVTEALRQRGIGSILRVHLSLNDVARCVLYVGIEDERPFTASEKRRLEGLSGALTTHLDNANLRSALRSKTSELWVEREIRERVVSLLIRDVRGPLTGARDLATAPELAATLGRIIQVVDQFLAMTPAVTDGAR